MNETRLNVRSLLEKSGRVQAVTPAQPPAADDGESDYTAFVHGRISRHTQLSLMLRFVDGSVRAFAYAYFCGAESPDPAAGFTLDFSQHKVKISGRNLEKVLQLICQHRVAEIREADRAEGFTVPEDSPLVERIEIQ